MTKRKGIDFEIGCLKAFLTSAETMTVAVNTVQEHEVHDAVGEQVDDSEILAQMAATRAAQGIAEPARASMGVVQPSQDAL